MNKSKKLSYWNVIQSHTFDFISDESLLQKIKEFFGDSGSHIDAFAHKLSKKQGWEMRFSYRAIEEYKRFLFLSLFYTVTPSKIVDEVWHQHILFTKDYAELSKKLDRNIHHNPGFEFDKAGEEYFSNQYVNTLQLYKSEFGHKPPVDIWTIEVTTASKKLETGKSYVKETFSDNTHSNVTSSGSNDLLLWYLLLNSDSSSYAPIHDTSNPSFDGFGGHNHNGFGGGGASGDFGNDKTSPLEVYNTHPSDHSAGDGGHHSGGDCTSSSDHSTGESSSGHSSSCSSGSDAGSSSSSSSSSSCSSGSSCGSSCGGGGD